MLKTQFLVSSLFFGLVLVFTSIGSKAQAIVFQKDSLFNLFTTPVDVFIDPSGRMSLKEVLIANKFKKKLLIRHNEEYNTLWARFIIQNNSESNLCLMYADLNISRITFYSKFENDWDSSSIEKSLPFASRKYSINNNVFDLNISKFHRDTVYVKCFSTHNFMYVGWVMSVSSFFNSISNNLFDHKFYSGIVFVLIFYGVFMFVWLKRAVYLYFGMFSFSSLLFYFCRHGVDFQLIYPSYPSFAPYSAVVFCVFMVVSQYFYINSFCNGSISFQKNQRIVFLYVIVAFIVYVLYCNIVLHDLSLVPNLLLLPCLYFSILCWFRYLKYNKMPLLIVIGTSLNFLGIFFETFRGLGYLKINILIDPFVLKYILILDMMLFLLATIQYVKNLRFQTESLALELNKLVAQPELQNINNSIELGSWGPMLEVDNTIEKISKNFLELKISNNALQEQLFFIAKNKILQNEISLSEFKILFQDENVALTYLSDLKWKAGYVCKRCGSAHFKLGNEPFDRKCSSCFYNESPKVASVYEGIKIPLFKAYYLTYAFQQHQDGRLNISNLSTELDLRRQTISDFILKLKEKQNEKGVAKHWAVLIF